MWILEPLKNQSESWKSCGKILESVTEKDYKPCKKHKWNNCFIKNSPQNTEHLTKLKIKIPGSKLMCTLAILVEHEIIIIVK